MPITRQAVDVSESPPTGLDREAERAATKRAVELSKRGRRPRPAQETFKLGRYAITGKIATGGMATVYRGRLEGQGGFTREFAIKVIHPHLAAAEGFKDRFYDEARVASRVSHPNAVTTIDSDYDRGYHFLVLELIDGVTLRQLQTVGDGLRLDPAEAARVISDVARGLHAVHTTVDETGESMQVVHRDLSPHNLMLDATGRTVLIDLGLAKARGQLGHTQTGVLCGKLPYMSPEQSRVESLDARSDVFSLGSVLFELATGVPPFGDDHTPNTLENLRKCDPRRLGELLADHRIPAWLTQTILTCLRADSRERYPSAEALANALDESMRRAGVDEARVRQGLAARTRATQERLGPIANAAPLAPLIGTDPTGSHSALTLSTTISPWVRGLALVGAGAMVVLLGLSVIDAVSARTSETASGVTPTTPTLSSDALGEPTPAPVHVVIPAERPTHQPVSDPQQDPAVVDVTGAKPNRTRKRDHLAGFKSNPYD